MELKFKPKYPLFIYNPSKLDPAECTINVFPSTVNGAYSNNINIDIRHINKDTSAFISIYLNKNEARYLRDILSSFINEKDIYTEAED